MARGRSTARRAAADVFAALRTVEVVLTPACNLHCTYCYQGARPAGRMALSTLQGAVDALVCSRRPAVTLGFHGGEPLLAFDLLRTAVGRALEACRAGSRVQFRLTTNGTLLDCERAAFLADHLVDTRLSFDGVPAAQDSRAAGTFSCLDRLLDTLRRERPSYFLARLEVAVTLTAANLPFLADSVEFFLRKGVRAIRVSPRFTPDPDWHGGLLPELDRQIARVSRLSILHLQRTGLAPVAFLSRAAPPPADPPPWRGWACGIADGSSLCVDSDGEVTSCALLAPSSQALPSGPLAERLGPMRLGHILDPDLPRQLAAESAIARAAGFFDHRERRHSRTRRCRRCPVRRECAVCPLAAVYVPGNRDPHLVPELPCAFNRVAARYRALFPPQPSLADVLRGRASPLPLPASGP